MDGNQLTLKATDSIWKYEKVSLLNFRAKIESEQSFFLSDFQKAVPDYCPACISGLTHTKVNSSVGNSRRLLLL
mgnify:CR=1 FL=1